jgi:preprotein translocase subunit SecD
MPRLLWAFVLICIFGCSDRDTSADSKGGVEITFVLENFSSQYTDMDAARKATMRVLEERVVQMGVVEARVTEEGSDRIRVTLPGYKDIEKARRILSANPRMAFFKAGTVVTPRDDSERRRPYDLERVEGSEPHVVFIDRATYKRIEPKIGGTKNPEYLKIIQGWGKPILDGSDLEQASFQSRGDSYVPLLQFRKEGSDKLYQWTRRHRTSQENIALVIDDVVITLNPLAPNTVLRDQAVIEGAFSAEYVKSLRDLLNAGALPGDLVELSHKQLPND